MSSISLNPDNSYDEEIEMIKINFDKDMPEKVETNFDINLKKKINKELKDLGQPKLWKEPNFSEWFDSEFNQDRRIKNSRAPISVNRYFDDE